MKRLILAYALCAAVMAMVVCSTLPASAEPATRVFLNGAPSPVYFNDGDSFRVLAGPYAGSKARLAGFNSLESFGGAHRWGDWQAKELFFNAKMATKNAAHGVWHCKSDMSTDTYGRVLWFCDDLAIDQVKRGLAHALSIDEKPADPRVLEAQLDAQKNHRGMWAHGVPGYIMSSAHSSDEGGSGKDGRQYNRMVSTRDGHSASMAHTDKYNECQWVCAKERQIPIESIAAAAKELKKRVPELDGESSDRVLQMTEDWAKLGWFVGVDEGLRGKITTALEALRSEGVIPNPDPVQSSCFIYVAFERRYGPKRAECLK